MGVGRATKMDIVGNYAIKGEREIYGGGILSGKGDGKGNTAGQRRRDKEYQRHQGKMNIKDD